MKRFAIIRIIIWSVVAVILLGILSFGLSGGWNLVSRGWRSGYTQASEGRFDASEIDEIEIEWVSGHIYIQEGDEVSFSETSSRELKDSERMGYRVDGRRLILRAVNETSFFSIGMPTKDLHLTLPPELAALNLEAVSADVEMTGSFQIDIVNMEGVSGRWKLAELKSQVINFETVSGDVEMTLAGAPRTIDVETVSGDLTIYWPDESGFTAELDRVSGNLNCDFATTSKDDSLVYGDGQCRIDGDTVSGDLNLRRK